MRCLFAFALLTAFLAIGQQDVQVKGREVSQTGAVTTARGDATLANSTVRIQADAITYNRSTGEAEATGKVHIQFLSKAGETAAPAPYIPMSPEERLKQLRRFPPDIISK